MPPLLDVGQLSASDTSNIDEGSACRIEVTGPLKGSLRRQARPHTVIVVPAAAMCLLFTVRIDVEHLISTWST
jgi:hypothetical protein